MNQTDTIRFIELYKSYPVLHNLKDRNYRAKKKREEAWKEISENMKLTVPILKERMKNLMGTYRSEKSRERKNYGSSGHPYKSNWFGLKYLDFLGSRKDPTENSDSLGQVNEDSKSYIASQLALIEAAPSAYPPDGASEISTTSVGHHRRRKKLPPKRKIGHADNGANITDDDPDKEYHSSLKKPANDFATDPFVSYGQYIANELRKYDSQTLAYVKRAISDVLFDADTGTLIDRFGGPPSFQSSTFVQNASPVLTSPSVLSSSDIEDGTECV